MQNLRIGSIVSVGRQVPNGSGGYNVTYDTNVEVTNLTDAYIEYKNSTGTALAIAWHAAFQVSITTP